MADKDNMLNRDDENGIASSVFVKAPRIGSEPINGKMVESKTSSETSLGSGDISTIRSEMYQKGSQFANSNDTGTLVNHDGSVRSSTSKTAEWSTWLGDKVSYNKRQTIKEIGRHLSERMWESIRANGGNEETSAAIPGVLGYPGNGKVNAYGLSGKYSENPFEGAYDYNGEQMAPDYLDLSTFNNTKVRKAEDAKNKSDAFPWGLAMGESMVLNPDFQFNELDDVRANWRTPYIGALYNERIYAFNLPKVFFQVGTVSINMKMITGLSALWFNNREGKSLSEYLKDPSSTNVIKKIAANLQGMIGTTASSIARVLMRNKRMYKFTPNNAVFLKYVDEILAEIAAWMGLTNSDIEKDNKNIKSLMERNYSRPTNDDEELEYDSQNVTYDNDEKKAFNLEEGSDGTYIAGQNISDNASDDGEYPKYNYLGKRKWLSVLDILPMTSDVRTAPSDKNDFENNISNALYNTDLLIPFGLSRGVNVSETFSNETQENPIISTINSTGQNNQSQMMIGQIPSNALGGVDQVIDAMSNSKDKSVGATMFDNMKTQILNVGINKFKDMLGGKMSGELGMVQMGNARMILPEIWTDSSFDRSYSLNFKFFSPYGNRLSIFENTIVPLVFLIAMTSPRQVGESSYTTPFCVKCFSKGLFSTNIGIVSSLTINRGEGKNDRTQEGFARTVSVSMSIKDLLPRLTMSLDAGTWGILGAKNCAFRDYIAFVAGVDMANKEMVRNQFGVYLSVMRNKYSIDKIKSNLRYSFSNTLPIRLITNPRSIFYKEDKGDTLHSTNLPSNYYTGA